LVEAARKNKEPSYKSYKDRLDSAMRAMTGNMATLFDLLAEEGPEGFPVKPGEFVTMPYKGTERRAEILVVSPDRVHFVLNAVGVRQAMGTKEFRDNWSRGVIRPYVEEGAREKYLGDTPGKASATGKVVLSRYKFRTTAQNVVEVEWQPEKWHPLDDCDMSHHPLDAVDYWNNTGIKYEAKAKEVRDWRLDPKNYILEPSSDNRRRGAASKSRYLAPP